MGSSYARVVFFLQSRVNVKGWVGGLVGSDGEGTGRLHAYSYIGQRR